MKLGVGDFWYILLPFFAWFDWIDAETVCNTGTSVPPKKKLRMGWDFVCPLNEDD